MSRNNVIVVAKRWRGPTGTRYYVLPNLNADVEWDEAWVRARIDGDSSLRYTWSHAKALLRAHDAQLRLDTEYGVREMLL